MAPQIPEMFPVTLLAKEVSIDVSLRADSSGSISGSLLPSFFWILFLFRH